ncbi:MAG: hypothetical protein L0Z50_38230 [Verrucomicrobiales bacterium]|nr:hypothetical protein [Verrucomicrobiales bacterium]
MTTSVLYYNRGTSCYSRLLTSIFSLRKHYAGLVTLMQEGPLDEGVSNVLKKLNVRVQPIPESIDRVLVQRSSLWRFMEEDHAMMLDSDTIVRGPVDEFLDWTKQWGFVASWFSGWVTTGHLMRRRIEQWRRVAPELVSDAVAYGKAINGGVQGWSKATKLLPAYEELTRRGDAAGCDRIVLDEIALQLLLPCHRHYLAHHIWNTSGAFGEIKQARIVHYHGRKHCQAANPRCDLWKEHYFELRASFPEDTAALGNPWGDKRLRRFQLQLSKQRDMTIVTAVDPRYANRLRRNIKAWMQMPGIREQRFLIFVNGFKGAHERRFLDYPNVKVVRWNYADPSATRREFMLAAFVFGVAAHVKTRYWMKLDADCQPQRLWWEWPEYEGNAIVSHRWGFTRMKGDPNPRHWFNRLDDVFSPEKPYFAKTFDAVADHRVSHFPGNPHGLPRRFGSFCHIERTEFTQRIAAHLNRANDRKMAIPSQDTTSWYCALLWNERMMLLNMKKWFSSPIQQKPNIVERCAFTESEAKGATTITRANHLNGDPPDRA